MFSRARSLPLRPRGRACVRRLVDRVLREGEAGEHGPSLVTTTGHSGSLHTIKIIYCEPAYDKHIYVTDAAYKARSICQAIKVISITLHWVVLFVFRY